MATANTFRTTLLVGVGGTGSAIAQNVFARAKSSGMVEAGRVRVLAFDTDENDQRRLGGLDSRQKIRTSSAFTIDKLLSRHKDIEERWFVIPREQLPMELRQMNLMEGAGQIRMLSRLALHDAFSNNQIEDVIGRALSELAEFDNREGYKGMVSVLLVGSLAGATGSGSFLQLAMAIKDIAQGRRVATVVRGLFMMPDIYVRSDALPRGQIPNVLANGYASLKEYHAAIMKATQRSGRFEFDFEYGPGRTLATGDIPFASLTLVDFEDMQGGNLGPSIPAYRRFTERAAYALMFTPIGGKADSIIVNDALEKLAAAGRNTHNSIASIGLSSIVYPHDHVVEYLGNQVAREILAGDWLRLDDLFKIRLRRFREQRAAGNSIAVEPDQGTAYLQDLRQLALDEKVPFFREIHDSLYPEVRDKDGSVETESLPLTYLSAIKAQVVRSFWNTPDLEEIPTRRNADVDQFATEEALAEEVRKRENRLDDDYFRIEQALVSRPTDIILNLTTSADGLPEADWRDYHLQTYLIRSGPHLVRSRSLLFALREALAEALAGLRADALRTQLFALSNHFDPNRGKEPDRRGTPATVSQASVIAQRGTLGRLLKGGRREFVEAYVNYYNGSIRLLRLYAEARLLEKVYEFLQREVEEQIRVLNGLFLEIEGLRASLGKQIEDSEKKHGESRNGENTLYVCADRRCLTALWDEVANAMGGQRLGAGANQALAASCYAIARQNRVKQQGDALLPLRDLFSTTVVQGFARDLVVNDYARIHDLTVIEAVRKDASIPRAGGGAAPDTRDAGDLLRQLIDIASAQSQPMITLSSPADGQRIRMWAFHPDLREQMRTIGDPDRLLNPADQGTQSIEEPEFPKTEMLSISFQVNLELSHLAKLSPPSNSAGSAVQDRAGRYFDEYRRRVDELIDAAGGSRIPRTLTPHIHRDWHKPGLLPEISDAVTERLVADINKAFAVALAFDLLKLGVSHDRRVAEIRTIGRVGSGSVSVELAQSHDLFTVLRAFETRPEAVRGCLRFWDEELRRLATVTNDPAAQAALSPDAMDRILRIGESRRDAEVRDQRLTDLVRGYAHMVTEIMAATRPDLPQAIQHREADAAMVSLGKQSLDHLRAAGAPGESLGVIESRFAYGLEGWREDIGYRR